jgi:hypothetical protein
VVYLYPSPGVSLALDAPLSRKGRGRRGGCAMSRPETPFPKHWRYYIFIKWAVIVAAVLIVLKLFGVF